MMRKLDGAGWSWADTFAVATITVIAATVRAVGITSPDELVFDEDYYARDACTYVETSSAICGAAGEATTMHPPLGKWLIAGGIELFGFQPLGWRIASVLAGTLTVALLYVLARRLFGSTLAAAVASGALAIDFLHVVMSRVAMLDVFVTLFGVAAVLFVIVDRDAVSNDEMRGPRQLRARPGLAAAGVMTGAAIAAKWSGVLVLACIVVLTAIWEIARRRPGAGAVHRVLREEWAPVSVLLLAVPLVVYVASYIGRLDATFLAMPGSPEWWPRAFAGRQLDMLRFHAELQGDHVYASPAWSWLPLKRPVAFYFEATGGRYREILALGNPVAWWPAIAAVAFAGYRLARHARATAPELVVVVLVTLTYLPWLALTARRDVAFLYYLLPTVPWLCLALGLVAKRLVHSGRVGRALVPAWALLVVVLFAFYYPLLTARPLVYSDWKQRVVFHDCETSAGEQVPHVVTGRTQPRLGIGRPPSGWCWI